MKQTMTGAFRLAAALALALALVAAACGRDVKLGVDPANADAASADAAPTDAGTGG
ncbi:MAG TPA: hypothetical protein VN962_24700 [Polyangia bacterium]|nr:hypothetical protein [Polyangia bacterium]